MTILRANPPVGTRPALTTAAGGFELAMQRASGIGLIAFLVQGVLQAAIGRELYATWWWAFVAPLLLAVVVSMIVLCLLGRLRARWAVAAAVSASVCFVLTSVATRATVLVEATAATSCVMGMAGLLGFILRPRWAIPLAGAMILSSAVSMYLTRPVLHPDLVALTVIQFVLVALGQVQAAIGRRTTAAEDEAADRLRRALIADRAAAAARADRRALERRMHDKVLNTLTALGRGGLGDSQMLRARCADDAAFLRGLRRAATGEAAGETTGETTGETRTDLQSALDHIAREATTDRFAVTVTGSADHAALPAPVVLAVSEAVREAVANAARHAGTPAARICVRVVATGVKVTVTDRGRGPAASAGSGRLGIRRSIVERMADVGGEGRVEPADGGGTAVTVRWPR